MKKFAIGNCNSNGLEKCVQESGELKLLAKNGSTEIMTQNIKKGMHFFINQDENDKMLEFFFMLSGEIELESEIEENVESKKLIAGQYFYANEYVGQICFKTLTDTTLLYVSNKPVFYLLSERINELRKIALKSSEKDLYTHNHGDRVKYYSMRIAEEMGLPGDQIERICFASLFHDIGKINVPDEVLKKPGRLTDEEMEHIKKHPADGFKMVAQTYYENIGEIVLQHHERMDGTGYPRGLKGDEICLEARIIAVADCFDAMTTTRPYRGAMTTEKALGILGRETAAGMHDRQVYEVLCELIEKEEAEKDKEAS